MFLKIILQNWRSSSVGRVFAWHAGKPEFDAQHHINWLWGLMSVLSGLQRQRQKDPKFKGDSWLHGKFDGRLGDMTPYLKTE